MIRPDRAGRERSAIERAIGDACNIADRIDDRDGTAEYFCPVCRTRYPRGTWFCPSDGSALRQEGTADLVGRVVADRYRVLRQIGEGAMGRVYAAQHVRMGRPCALKIMNPSLRDDPESLARFGREAANASRIDHPYVASIYDFGETADGLIYLAMEHADGQPLSVLIEDEGPFEFARAARMAKRMAQALAAAHERGIIHRDLKPDNVIVGRRGGTEVPKLIDFGVACVLQAEEAQRLTRTGYVIGTPRYMSPEQVSGEPMDGRSDIYSLACILFEMVTGSTPFAGGTADVVVSRRLTEPPPSPSSLRPDIPAGFEAIISRGLAREPADRYASAADVAVALEPFTTLDTAAPVVGLPPARHGPSRVRTRLTSGAATLAVAMLAAAVPHAQSAVSPAIGVDTSSTSTHTAPPEPAESSTPATESGRVMTDTATVATMTPLTAAGDESAGIAASSAVPERDAPSDPAPEVDERPVTRQSAPVERPAPPPPTIPSLAAIDSVRSLLREAVDAAEAGDWAKSFAGFDAVRLRLGGMRLAFPTAGIIAELELEHERRLRHAVGACNEISRVRRDLGLDAPACEARGLS